MIRETRLGGDPRDEESREVEDVASYVASITTELTALARQADLVTLAYFLDMARHEAQSIIDAHARPPGKDLPDRRSH